MFVLDIEKETLKVLSLTLQSFRNVSEKTPTTYLKPLDEVPHQKWGLCTEVAISSGCRAEGRPSTLLPFSSTTRVMATRGS